MFDPVKFLEDYQDEARREFNERSPEYCGWCNNGTNPNGVIVQAHFTCNKWRECQNCYNKRKVGFKRQLENMPEDTVVIICDTDVAKKLLRKRQITSEDYFRSPIDNDKVAIAISEILLDEIGFDDYLHMYDLKDRHLGEQAEVNDVLVEIFTNIPFGMRTSGDLGKLEKKSKLMYYEEPESEEDTVELLVSEIITDSGEDVPAAIFEEATLLTSEDKHQDRNAMPIEDVYYERQKLFEAKLYQNGVSFHVLRRSVKLVSRKWMENNFVFIKVERDVKITSNIDLLVLSKTASRTYYRQISHYADMEKQEKYAF